MIHAAERAARPAAISAPARAVGRVGALVLHRRGGVLTFEIQRLGEVFEFLAGVGHGTS